MFGARRGALIDVHRHLGVGLPVNFNVPILRQGLGDRG